MNENQSFLKELGILLESSGEHQMREIRMMMVIGYIFSVSDQNIPIYMEDWKGHLTVIFKSNPSEDLKQAFRNAWGAKFSNEPSEHITFKVAQEI